jgi:AcrR family transcriptional regulator
MSRKVTQRERLLAGMLEVANHEGYAGTSVAAVIAAAGVSRPTFYEYFSGREDCFLAVHREISERLLAQLRDAVEQAPPERAPQAAIRRLIERAAAEPARAQFIAAAAMAGGPCALDARDGTIEQIERLIETAGARTPPEALSPDLPTRALIGATHWLLTPRLRRGERDLAELARELDDWIASYSQPHGSHRWRTLHAGPVPAPSPYISELPLRPPAPLPPGRSRLPAAEIAHNQRERILYATAEIATEVDYTASTIAGIIALARVERRVFYKHFRDKQQAFLAVHELGFQQAMAVGASGFFSAGSWPERIWQGIHAGGQFAATHPTIARIGFVESHAVGADAIQRVEDTHAAFAIFLQEGNKHTSKPLPASALRAIVAANFEIVYRQLRGREPGQLPRYTPHAVYIALAPFLGPDAANAFIDAQLQRAAPGA